jgi:hypothetical protein
VLEGTLIAESLRVGTSLENMELTLRKISRYRVTDAAPGQPGIWCVMDFEADEGGAERLAQTFAAALDEGGWYVNFQTPGESFVVYPDRTFRYPRGDAAARAEAQAHGRHLGIPDPQLDWTV